MQRGGAVNVIGFLKKSEYTVVTFYFTGISNRKFFAIYFLTANMASNYCGSAVQRALDSEDVLLWDASIPLKPPVPVDTGGDENPGAFFPWYAT